MFWVFAVSAVLLATAPDGNQALGRDAQGGDGVDDPSRGASAGALLSEEETKRAAPIADEFGARFNVRVRATSRKRDGLLSDSGPVEYGWLTPLGNYLLERSLGDGRTQNAIRLPQPTALAVFRNSMAACTLEPDGERSAGGDILFLGEDLVMGSPHAREVVLRGHTQAPWSITLSPSPTHRKLVSCSDDGTARLWELTPSAALAQFMAGLVRSPNINYGKDIARFDLYNTDKDGSHLHGVFVAFSPLGRWLATTDTRTVSLRSADDGSERQFWPLPLEDAKRIMAIRFDSLGNTLLAFLKDVKATGAAVEKAADNAKPK
jgi:hypothetical protein